MSAPFIRPRLISAAEGRVKRKPDVPVWNGVEYSRVPPGIYDVRCTDIQGPEWLKNRRRHSLRLECSFLMEEGNVSGFFNLGTDSERYHFGRGSRFYEAWCMANGGPPRKGQMMSFDIFRDKFFRVRVDYSKDQKGEYQPECKRYSKIYEFLACIGP